MLLVNVNVNVNLADVLELLGGWEIYCDVSSIGCPAWIATKHLAT